MPEPGATPIDQSGEDGPAPSDEDLVREFQRDPGSEAARRAAGALFSRYDRRVYLWCLKLARDHDRALDLAQEALLTALRDLPGFEHRSRFATWLYTVVRRRALRLLRRERMWLTDEADLDGLVGNAPDPIEVVLREIEEEQVIHAIRESLDPIEATALMLRCHAGLPVEDITRMLGLSGASGARGVLQAARRKLRSALERRRPPEDPK